jgi:hypothetical protein
MIGIGPVNGPQPGERLSHALVLGIHGGEAVSHFRVIGDQAGCSAR